MSMRSFLAGVLATAGLALGSSVQGQAVRTQPYNAQLPTDPAVGNVQGIQRYGRSLVTDPDEGEGFSYHVYPVRDTSAIAFGTGDGAWHARAPLDGARAPAQAEGSLLNLQQAAAGAHQALVDAMKKQRPKAEIDKLDAAYQEADKKLKEALQRSAAGLTAPSHTTVQPFAPGVTIIQPGGPPSPYPPPFNPTAGLRLPPPASYAVPAPAPGQALTPALVPALVATGDTTPPPPRVLLHQPLIQVKMRVVEVDRSKLLQVSSVLDFIRMPFSVNPNTLITGNNINRDRRDLSGGTRFPLPDDFINFTGNNTGTLTGTGALVNLTTGNLNYIARLLEEEFHADTITAPEVVTLNGQSVEFVAGQKVPFELGQNVIQGNNNNIQQFFYKHVGTFIAVTPQIVNWGFAVDSSGQATQYGTAGGQAPLTYAEVPDWNLLVKFLRDAHGKTLSLTTPVVNAINELMKDPNKELLVPVSLRADILKDLNRFAKADLIRLGLPIAAPPPGCDGGPPCRPGSGCDWRPEDCTIDLTVVMRLSTLGTVSVGVAPAGASPQTIDVGTEDNVRAIANVVQVKSGHGVVMGGLISDHETKDVSKVPVLGDIPGVGALFRSKSVNRQKTEILLFIEAQVLDPNPPVARAQSAHDYPLGQAFVAGEFLDNPLELGMYRAGFGPYLPPHSAQEKVFWERLGRRVRNMATTIDDVFE